ncbi:MAG: TonB-dependent receptor plug domain-containing protein [bacterium]|nr:TonB-dependent receptor plug domain-containing protein [bacterium]
MTARKQAFASDLTQLSLDSLLNLPIRTSVKYEQKASEAPASVTVITREQIHRYGYRTLDEALRGVRGFYISYDRNYATAGTRGFGRPTDYNDRLLLLINGHIYNDAIYQTAALGTDLGLDLDAVDRIEIIRGPNSTLYGTSAMLAVINVITSDGARHQGLSLSAETGSGWKREAAIRYGAPFGRDGGVFLAGSWGAVDGRDLYFREFDDPSTNNGRAVGLDWDRYAGFSGKLRTGGFNAQAFFATRTKGVPTASWDVEFNNAGARSLDQRGFLEFRYERDLGGNRHWTTGLSADHYRYGGWYPYETMEREQATGTWIDLESQFRWDVLRRLRITFGGRIQENVQADYRYISGNETWFEGDFPFSLVSFYGQTEIRPLSGLTFLGGLGRDAYSTSFSSVMPHASMIARPFHSTTVKAVYAEGFRAPNVYEWNYEEPDLQKRNPYLRPERIKTVEGVLEQRISGGLLASVSAYHYRFRDLIEYSIEPQDSMFVFNNLQRLRTRGMELELNGRFDGWSMYGSCSFQDARDRVSGEKLSNAPEILLRTGSAVPVGRGIVAALEIASETGRRTLSGSQIPGFCLVDLNLTGWRPIPGTEMEVKVRNLFDVRYRLPGGTEHRMDAIRQDGRSFAVRVTLTP